MLGRVVLILNRPRPHNLCGVSCSQYPRWDITEDSRSRTDDCPLSDGDARADEYVRGYPRVLTYDNGSGNKRQGSPPGIATSRAQKRILTDSRVYTQFHLIYAIAIHMWCQTTTVGHFEVPRCPNSHTRIGMSTPSYRRSEQSEQNSPPSMKYDGARPE